MDASASRADAEYNKLFSVYVKIQNPFPPTSKHKTSVAKYTRLSELDLNSKGPWTENKYSLEPRLRRIIAIEEPNVETTRSLKSNVALAPKMSTTGYSKRKIVTIEEDEKKSLHPKFSRDVKNSYTKMINRAVETGLKDQKLTHRTTSRLSNSSKYFQDGKQNLKTNSLSARKEASVPNFRNKQTKENPPYTKGKESQRNLRSTSATSKISQSKRVTPSDSERAIQTIKNKLKEETKDSLVIKRIAPKERFSKTSQEHNRMKSTLIKEISESKKPITVIHVPLEEDFKKQDLINQFLTDEYIETAFGNNTVDCIKELDEIINFKDVNVGTDPIKTVDQVTETVCDFTQNSQSISNEIRDKSTFDSLEIPNVTLIKDKEPKENIVNFNSQSLPNLRASAISVTPNVKEKIVNESCFRKSTSYIISTATLTYTTKQKINFHVVENEPDMNLTPCTVSYPMNVISVYKKEIKGKQSRENTPKRQEEQDGGHSNDTECPSRNIPLDCLKDCDRNKLMKPSDIISSINADNSLVPNDYINEQFQRELNFIDSFLESLQYLESCSLTENRITQSNVDNLVNNTYDLKKLEYDSFFSKFDNSHNVDDRETMASKSLCLLNLLIRDEQRRAKNLLFVLKMREDALKDFTKSQILWLENRKKQDNTDISTLKKKQRGALLKLQHECGEMQRMRKALLTLSEKRKVALMKTKRNIELKFKNPVDVEQIIIEKRKLKRSTSTDRNTAPLKCFDLSSSGCEESTTSRPKSITPVCILKPASDSSRSAEKYVQTGDSILSGSTVNQSTSTADENFVVVDGGYLNILFQNLTLPEIFSSGKQYEVNEEALRNIVTTTNSKQFNVKEEDVIKKFMDQVKSQDADRSSSPSTARSLVEELDLYYKALTEKDKSPIPSPDEDGFACEVKDVSVQMNEEATWEENETSKCLNGDISANGSSVESVEAACLCEPLVASAETQCVKGRDDLSMSVAGPLPVPAGAAAIGDSSPPDQLTWTQQKNSSSSTSPGESSSVGSPLLYSSMSSLMSPAQSEAEELRRQQLAIEREIKALEQQQCQLLVVREIPDKPPPPYTPPSETRSPKPRKFCVEPNIEEKVHDFIANSVPTGLDEAEPFDAFLLDYCQESLDRQKKERGDKFWDTCHDLPPKPQLDAEKLAKKTTAELREVLTGVTPTVVSGVGARRSDHIDDILFAEWRRCEPEWTSLHTDEVIVKNQLFESIFQKILTETIDEYKKTVLAKEPDVNVTVTL